MQDESATAGGDPGRSPEGPVRPPHATDYGEQDENGVDLSLLRYMLQLSPLERLRLMEDKARETLILYEYGRRHREAQSAEHR